MPIWSNYGPEELLVIILVARLTLDIVLDAIAEQAPGDVQMIVHAFMDVMAMGVTYVLLRWVCFARTKPLMVSPLTPREREVYQLAGQGLTNRQIAQQLNTSERTVETQVASIRVKLGLQSRRELVQRARDEAI